MKFTAICTLVFLLMRTSAEKFHLLTRAKFEYVDETEILYQAAARQ